MPGIYGIYRKSPRYSREFFSNVFNSMGTSLKHKKDLMQCYISTDRMFVGKICLHNEPHSVHPVWNHEKNCVALIDGTIFSQNINNQIQEIYDVEKHLHVLMKEFRDSGNIDKARLNGEFNLIIVDIKKNRQLIINDRWGFRELYLYEDDDVFIFAPEVKAILKYNGVSRKINEQGVIDLINFGYPIGNKTLVSNISLLPQASSINIDGFNIQIETEPFKKQKSIIHDNYSDYIDNAYNLLNLAVERRLRKREKVAASLSGGLDSRIIAGLIENHIESFDSYSFGSNDRCKEFVIAKKVSDAIPGCSVDLARTVPDDISRYADWAVWSTDGMVNLSLLCCFLGSMLGVVENKHYDILLGGFTGDLILGGSFISDGDINEVYSQQKKIERFKFRVGERYLRPFVNDLFTEDFGKKVNYYADKSVEEEAQKVLSSNLPFTSQQDYFVIMTRCRRRLNTYRGLVGHSSVEEYYPFFDNDFFDYIYSIPDEIRVNHKLYKDIFKKYFPDLAKIPWFNTGVSLYKKDSNLYNLRKKADDKIRWYIKRMTSGRVNLPNTYLYTPHNDWFRTNKNFRNFISGILLDKRTINRGYFKDKGIKQMLSLQMKGWDYFEILERLVVAELWFRQFIDGDDKKFESGFDMDSSLFGLNNEK